MGFNDDYIDVPARIAEFRAKHPDGSLMARVIRWPEDGFPFIAVEARAYRTPSDPRPGVGLAYEPFPGKTNFTRDSELQNAETSAWGRAIVAVGAADTKKGIASAEEVRNRQSSGAGAGGSTPAADPKSSPAPVSKRDERGNQDGPKAVAGEVGPQQDSVGSVVPAAAPSHVHEWIPAPNERMARLGWESCSVPKCQETRNQRKGK